jgi:peptidoglycan/LPS O-acetylase OafA/YrhL
MNNEINKDGYFVNLDAMRFFAALAVLIFHYFAFLEHIDYQNNFLSLIQPLAKRGHLGVNFFFVLSAFLISILVFREIDKTGTFSLRYFLIRRTLRIWPLYFLVVGLSFLIIELFPIYGDTRHEFIWYAFFLSNFGELQNGLNDAYTQLTIPWSVSIEEQFYIFWALIIGGFQMKKRKSFLTFFTTLLCSSLFFRLLFFDEERVLYYHTFSAVTDLSIGALTAYLFHFHIGRIKRIVSPSKSAVVIIYLSIFLLILLKNKIFQNGYLIVLERPIIASCFAWIIVRQIVHPSILKGKLKSAVLHFGKISFGIYMYHCLVLFFIEIAFDFSNGNAMILILLPIGATVTVMISHLSYQYFEKFFLKLKKNYSKIE